MSVSALYEVAEAATQAKSIRCYDLFVDGTAHLNLAPGSITAGVPNTFLQTNGASNVVWNSFALSSLPGGADLSTLRTKTGTVQWDPPNLDILPAGVNGQLLSTVAGNAAWANAPGGVKQIRYSTAFDAQNLNAAAGPNPCVFSTTPIYSIAVTNDGTAITGITALSPTQFFCNYSGHYDFNFSGFIDPASPGIGAATIYLSIEVNGTQIINSSALASRASDFSGEIKSIPVLAGQIIRILVTRLAASPLALNVFAAGSVPPNFISTLSITLVNII